MRSSSFKILALILSYAAVLSGCSNNQALPTKNESITGVDNTNPVNSNSDNPLVDEFSTINEIMPEDSGLVSRQIIKGISGKPIEIRFKYKDGDNGVQYLDEMTGNVKECKELFTDQKTVKSHAVFDTDGKTLVKGELYRPDGSLRLTKERMANGYYQISRFSANCQHPFSVETPLSETETDRKIFREDGTILAQVLIKKEFRESRSRYSSGYSGGDSPGYWEQRLVSSTYFKPDGKKEFVVRYGKDMEQTEVDWYRTDGTISHVQIWHDKTLTDLVRIKEFAADGKTKIRDLEISTATPVSSDTQIISVTHVLTYEGEKRISYTSLDTSQALSPDPKGKITLSSSFRPNMFPLETKRFLVVGLVTSEYKFDSKDAIDFDNETIHKPEDNVLVPVDQSLFKFPRNRQLDERANSVMGESNDYFGPVINNDPCRYWYNNL